MLFAKGDKTVLQIYCSTPASHCGISSPPFFFIYNDRRWTSEQHKDGFEMVWCSSKSSSITEFLMKISPSLPNVAKICLWSQLSGCSLTFPAQRPNLTHCSPDFTFMAVSHPTPLLRKGVHRAPPPLTFPSWNRQGHGLRLANQRLERWSGPLSGLS